jgi:hypothetical protein
MVAKSQVPVGTAFAEVGDDNLFAFYLGPLECACALGAGCGTATLIWTASL